MQKDENQHNTIFLFSAELDKVMAALNIATAAASMGKSVHIFFAFWGVSLLKKERVVKKSFREMIWRQTLLKV